LNRLAYALSFDNAESNVLDRIKFGGFNWTFAIQRLSERVSRYWLSLPMNADSRSTPEIPSITQ